MQCEYMLSYQILNKTEVDIELSALSKGWVAVGFSSDKYMVSPATSVSPTKLGSRGISLHLLHFHMASVVRFLKESFVKILAAETVQK